MLEILKQNGTNEIKQIFDAISNLYYDYEEYENICLDINYKRSIAGSKTNINRNYANGISR